MGKIVQGVCQCGYESNTLYVGCGFAGPWHYWVPVVCKQCGALSTVNLYQRRGEEFKERRTGPNCRKCKTRKSLFSDPFLHTPVSAAQLKEGEFPWESNSDAQPHEHHHETLYFCPQCKEIKMRLLPCGLWD